MAIAFDSITNGGYSGSASTSKTFAHTCTGSQRFLFVSTLTDTNVVTGMTYGGVAMTLLVSQATDYHTTIYGLINPASGVNNVVISCSGSTNIIPQAISYTGVDQTTLPTVTNTGTDASSPQTLSLTTTVNNSWIMGYQRRTVGAGASAGTGTIVRLNDAVYALATYDSNGPLTPAGSYGLTVNYTGTSYLAIVAFAPYVAPTTNGNFFLFFN